jgi:hypothetical protein
MKLAVFIQKFLTKSKLQWFHSHPSYSPYLSPAEFLVFQKMEVSLKGH